MKPSIHLNRLHPHPERVRQRLDQPAPPPLARLAKPPRLLALGHLPRRPLVAHVDQQVAERVAGLLQPPGAHDEHLVRPHVPVVAAEVGVVQPDRLGKLGGPLLGVDGPQVRALPLILKMRRLKKIKL